MKLSNSFHKYPITILFAIMLSLKGFSQHTIIPTGTTTKIREVRKFGNVVVLNGNYDYFAKCYGDCDQLFTLQPPGPFNYFNRYLNIIDTNRFYISSFMGNVPYHAIVSKTVDGGQNWTTILDTLSEDFYTVGLLVFDTNRIVLPVTINRTFVTSNGGDIWESGAQTGMPTVSESFRINDSTAIMGVQERLRLTTNKGSVWVGNSFVEADPTGFYVKTLDSIYTVSVGASGNYFSYIFGQLQAIRIDKLIPMMDPVGLYVVSKDEIYITGKGWPQEYGRIMKTTDLGNTWSYYDVPETEKLLEIVFLNDSTALIGGYNGALIKWNKNSPMTECGLGVIKNSNGTVSATIYPNPASQQQQELEINTVPGEKIEIQLYDIQGRNCGLIYSGVKESNQKSISIDLSQMDSGVYFYHLKIGDRSGKIRFIKE